MPVDRKTVGPVSKRRTMTRIRRDTVGLRRTTNAALYATTALPSGTVHSMETSIMSTDDGVLSSATAAEQMVVVQDVSAAIEQHQQHQSVSTMAPLVNGGGITVTLAANGTVTVDANDGADGGDNNKYDVADKDGNDLPAIDFASATNHNTMEPQTTAATTTTPSVISAVDDDKMRCYASNPDEDNETDAAMMMVDSVGATETAHCSSGSSSNSSSTSSNSNSSTSSSSGSSTSGSSLSQHPEPAEVEEEEGDEEEGEEEDEEEEEDDDEDGTQQDEEEELPPDQVASSVADESTSVDKQLHMMQTDDDPLLQETLNAIMNGAEGIEVVNTSEEHEHNDATSEAVPSDPSIARVIAAELTTTRPGNEEVETDRNYECTYCGKLFTRSNTLAYHLKVHTGERPFKCKHCAKAFREQYRLMKHLKTHSKYRNRRLERTCVVDQPERVMVAPPSVRVHLHRGASAALLAGANGIVAAGEEDYTTGDSERFFKSYDLPDGSVAMKLEPDISLTEDADISEVGPEAMLATEEVETAEDHHQPIDEEHNAEDPNGAQEGVGTGEGNEIRYQIIEERIKSLQREVHLVNQNLNRVETKVDGLTRIISLFIGKFEDEAELANQAAQLQQQQQQQQHQQQQEHQQDEQQVLTTMSTENETVVPVASLTVVSQPPNHHHHQHPTSASSTSPSLQSQKTIFLTSTTASPQTATATQVQVQPVGVFQTDSSPIATSNPAAHVAPRTKEARSAHHHYYQFAEPTTTTVVQVKPESSPPPLAIKVRSPSPTPSPAPQPSSVPPQTQQLTLAGVNGGNQLLDTFPEIPELPIRTVSDFLDLNDHCTDNEQFLLQMMIRLHQEIHNSQPFQRNIKRMMEALVTYEVLCQFSWSGKSAINGQYTKYVFGNSLGIIDLLTKTLNLGKSAQEAEANQKPIFAAIQSFIKHSRQNMIRDSRKRRDPRGLVLTAGGEVVAGMVVPDTTTTTIAYHVNGGERLQIKQLRSERHHHHQQAELVNPF
uniref:C2H2-type domain-containing protein n=1 Tax=Anopheles stephensi TaxID=30069 RepID=A0A182Y384_ANOST